MLYEVITDYEVHGNDARVGEKHERAEIRDRTIALAIEAIGIAVSEPEREYAEQNAGHREAGVNAESGQEEYPVDQVKQSVVQGETHRGATLGFTCGLDRPDAAYETVRGEPVKVDDAVYSYNFV